MAKLRGGNDHGHTAEDRRRVFEERERMRLEDKARRDAADALRRRLTRCVGRLSDPLEAPRTVRMLNRGSVSMEGSTGER